MGEEINTILDAYADYLRVKRGVSESAIASRMYILKKMLQQVGEIDNLPKVLKYIRQFAPATQSYYITVARSFYNFYADEYVAPTNPEGALKIKNYWEDVRGARGETAPKWLTEDETKILLHYAEQEEDPRIYATIKFLLETGLRVSEFINLSIRDFQKDGTDYIVTIRGKGRKIRKLRIDGSLYQLLIDSGFLKKKVTRQTVFNWVARVGKKAGLQVSPHTLRHTFAHRLTELGEPLPTVQALLGHSSLATTDRYVKEVSTNTRLGRNFTMRGE